MESWISQHLYVIYFLPLFLLWGGYAWYQQKNGMRAMAVRDENIAAGLDQPASLHPVINPGICIGCGACVNACPENNVLGLIEGRAELISPANCIGHGACKEACPVGGIELVFGTATRGVDIPVVKPDFESTVPGIYIAGELGGMGLVRNAIEQGKQAVKEIAVNKVRFNKQRLDLIIVGAGPAGIASGLMAKSLGLSYRILEQDSLGGTVAHFPRKKLVMTAPVDLPLVGKMSFRETSKEELMEYWQKVVAEHQLDIMTNQRVDKINQCGHGGFVVATQNEKIEGSTILLCLGRRGTPRKLNVEGEDSSKVVYRLDDARQYAGQHVLVVGGGDSALEAALSLADEPGTKVSISYRNASFNRAKPSNRQQILSAEESKSIDIYYRSEVNKIEQQRVVLSTPSGQQLLRNDAVIVCAGGVLPTGFLKSVGIEVATHYGAA